MKKQLLWASVLLLSAGLFSACGNGNGTSKQGSSAKKVSHKMVESKEDTVIKKYLEANEKIKGAKIKEKVTADTNEGSESKNVKMDMDVSYYADPFGSKADVATTVGSSVQHSTVLSDGKDMYLQLAIVYARGKTYRRTLHGQIGYNKFATDAANTAKKFLKTMKNNGAKVTLKDEGDEYVIKCDASKTKMSDKFKTETFRISSPMENTYAEYSKEELSRYKFEKYIYELHIDKKSYQPKSYTANVVTVRTGTDGTKRSRAVSFDATYSAINQTEQIKMPTTYIDYDQNHRKN